MTVGKKPAGAVAKAKKSTVKSTAKSKLAKPIAVLKSASGHNFRGFVENSPIATVVYDADFTVTFFNQAFSNLLGLKPGAIINKPLAKLFSIVGEETSPEDFASIKTDREYEILRRDGKQFWGLVSTWNANDSGAGKPTTEITWPKFSQIIDIDAQKKSNDKLAYRESIWKNAISASQLGVWDYNSLTDERFYSDYWKHIRGVPLDEEAKDDIKSWESRIHPDDLESVRDNVRRQNSGEMRLFSFEYRERRKDGKWVWILSRGRAVEWAEDGTPIRLTGTDSDITPRKETEQRRMDEMADIYRKHVAELKNAHRETKAAYRIAKAKSLQDPLTELANRCAFSEQISKKIKKSADGKAAFAVIMINLDKFKTINEEHGHLAGDRTLREMGRRLKAAVTPKDLVARLGGDEFGIILVENPGLDINQRVKMVTTKILDDIKEPFALGDHDIEITASIGISLYPEHGETSEDLFRAADVAMHDVKNGEEGGTWELFSPMVDVKMVSNSELEELTRIAVENEEIQPFYQPIVDFKSGQIAGFKVLPHWHHPERGVILPGNFLPIIEQAGLRIPFSKSIWRRACKACMTWNDDISLAMKISGRGIADAEVPIGVAEILEECEIAPNRLQVEVTETAIAEGGDAAKEVIKALRASGVRVVLDEFGTGKAGLSYLREFNFDGVRVDRSFIGSMGRSEASEKIVRSMISLAHELGIYSIAEGIEDVDTHMYMQHTGGTYGQGYFYGEPVPYDEATAMLEQSDGLLSLAG